MSFSRSVVIAFAVAMFSAAIVFAQSGKADTGKTTTANAGAEKTKQLKPQTTCPVTGDPINKTLFVDYKGKRIYVCCENCINPLKKNPEKYIKKLESMGQSVETIVDGTKKDGKTGKTDTSMKEMDMKGMKMASDTSAKVADTGYWTCTMHPQVHKTEPGNCPICGMKLVYRKQGEPAGKTKSMGGDMMMK
ncbi:MAG: heavy metal-binding domain-containing protein [Chitinispirillaceae bacterium]|jgi:YHS domain-containing protein